MSAKCQQEEDSKLLNQSTDQPGSYDSISGRETFEMGDPSRSNHGEKTGCNKCGINWCSYIKMKIFEMENTSRCCSCIKMFFTSLLTAIFICLIIFLYTFIMNHSRVPPVTLTDWMKDDTSIRNDERGYLIARDDLLLKEEEFEQRKFNYEEDESIVNHYLDYLKWREEKTYSNGAFPQLENILNRIDSSEIFEALKDLPKGGNLHSHENHQLSKRKLFDIIWSLDDFDYLYMVKPGEKDEWNTDFFVNPPTDKKWIKVKGSGYKKDHFVEKNTLINILKQEEKEKGKDDPTDSYARWEKMNRLWKRAGSDLIDNVNVRRRYLEEMYKESYKEGIIYLETRRFYNNSLYELDLTGASNKTYGKKKLSNSDEVKLALEVAKNFSETNEKFIGHKTIGYVKRSKGEEEFRKALNITLTLKNSFPEHIIGFDAVGEEDAGYSTLKFIHQYLTLFKKEEDSTLPLYLHSVETNWPIDLMTANKTDDLVPTLENAYESILLAAKRVGHGKGFLKMPYLREIMKKKQVAVEACVISNQLLGYDMDIRNHYAQVFHKEGIPIVLAPDDPAIFGYDTVVVDWYAAYMGWGLNLGDLKQIALNSLTYNGMNSSERTDAIENKWKPSWNEYIEKMKEKACNRNYYKESENENRPIKFIRLLPSEGYAEGNVHVFGRNFEVAICKKPKCRFGSCAPVEAIYLSNRHLKCPVPKCDGNSSNLLLHIALDGESFDSTNLTFTYLSTAVKNLYSITFTLLHSLAIATINI